MSNITSPGSANPVPDEVVTNGDATSHSDGPAKETLPHSGYTGN